MFLSLRHYTPAFFKFKVIEQKRKKKVERCPARVSQVVFFCRVPRMLCCFFVLSLE